MFNTEKFIREYTRPILEGYAAVFTGAGLSKSFRYTSWKDLIHL